MIQIVSTESGEATLKVDGRFVHSRRNPSSEAQRYFEAERGNRSCRTVLIVGAGLGYLTAEARRAVPGCRTVAVHLSPTCRASAVASADASWDPRSTEGIATFLDRTVGEEELSGLLTLFWRPALSAFPEEAGKIQTAVQEHISRLNASLATTGYFGPRWFRNGVANYLNVASWWKLQRVNAPVVVAAPGPSLQAGVEALRRARPGIVLVAVASAVHPLAYSGLSADVVVHQDAGFFSGEHLRPLHRSFSQTVGSGLESLTPPVPYPPLVQPLSARPLPRCNREPERPVAWLRYDHPLDALLLRHGGAAVQTLPQLGTVTATATRLALKLSSGPVFLAGVDMASWDFLSHARGHAFEDYHAAAACRLHPMPTTRVSRLAASHETRPTKGTMWRSSADLSIYAAWFRSISGTERLRRLAPSPVKLGIREAEPAELIRMADVRGPAPPIGASVPAPPRQTRLGQIAETVTSWLATAEAFRPEKNADLARAPSVFTGLARHLAMAELLRTERASPEGVAEVRALRDRVFSTLERVHELLEMQGESPQ